MVVREREMTANEVRDIQSLFIENGMGCVVVPDTDDVTFDIVWEKGRMWGHNGRRSGIDMIWFVVDCVCDDAEIIYLNGHDDGRLCYVRIVVLCHGRRF